jgi:hypothetical protein
MTACGRCASEARAVTCLTWRRQRLGVPVTQLTDDLTGLLAALNAVAGKTRLAELPSLREQATTAQPAVDCWPTRLALRRNPSAR